MHELSLSSAILDTALRHSDGRKVTAVEVTVGALRQVVPASLEFYWGVVTRDTDCEGARLDLRPVEARLRCKACDAKWSLDEPDFRCTECASTDIEVLTGTELFVESIDVKEEEPCTVRG